MTVSRMVQKFPKSNQRMVINKIRERVGDRLKQMMARLVKYLVLNIFKWLSSQNWSLDEKVEVVSQLLIGWAEA